MINAYPGNVIFYSAVCLDDDTHHSSVDFTMDTERRFISVFGTVAKSVNEYNPTFEEAGNCSTNELTQWIDATYRAETETSISDISLN